MNVIAIDDEPLALKDLVRTLHGVMPACEPLTFATPRAALEHARREPVDVAFLDIEMPGMSGLSLAKELKDLYPDLHVVFVTSYSQYAVDAFALHATGYLLKPVHAEDLARELTFIYEHRAGTPRKRVRVQTFGGFEIFVDDAPLAFKRSKSKELLALLVDRHGGSVSAREACALLWEDAPHNASQRSYYQTIVADLRSALASVQADDVLVKAWNSLAVNPDLLDCDSYRFLEGDPAAINAYRNDYLPSYSWAEFSVGAFHKGARPSA